MVTHRGSFASLFLAGLLIAAVAAACDEPARQILEEDATPGDADLIVDTVDVADLVDTVDAVEPDGRDVDTAEVVAPSDGFSTLYTATTGVAVPTFVPIDATGSADALELGPDRAADYQLGEAELRFMLPSPSGEVVVVGLQQRDDTAWLFALPTDAAGAVEPVLLASFSRWIHELHVDDRGAWVVLADQSLHHVPLDASQPAVQVAAVSGPDVGLTRPCRVEAAQRVAFEIKTFGANSQTHIGSAAVDGSQPDTWLALTDASDQQHIEAVLDDGRLVVSRDDVLYAVLADGSSPAVRLTPSGRQAKLEGVLDAGQALLVGLGEQIVGPGGGPMHSRDIARVALDGSNADTPILLLDDVSYFAALSTGDGALITSHADADGTTHSLVELAVLDGSASPRQLSPPLSQWPLLAALTDDEQAAIVAVGSQLLRVERSGDATIDPRVLFDTGGAVVTWHGELDGGRHGVISFEAEAGRVYWSVPFDGSAPIALEVGYEAPTPAMVPMMTPRGLLWANESVRSGLFVRLPDASIRGPVGGWLNGEVGAAHLLDEEPPRVVLRLDDRLTGEGRWHAVRPTQLENERQVLSERGVDGVLVATVGSVLLVFDALGVPDPRLLALDGGGSAREVARVQVGRWTLAETSGEVLHVTDEGSVLATSVASGETRTVFELPADAVVHALAYVAAGEQVVVGSEVEGESVLHVAALSGGAPPRQIPLATAQLPWVLSPVPGSQRVLVDLASLDATPRLERRVLSIDLADDAVTPLLTDVEGASWLWRVARAGEPPLAIAEWPLRGSTTADGAWALLATSEQVYAVRPDGSEVVEVVAGAYIAPLAGDAWLGPDDRTVLGVVSGELTVVAGTVGDASAARALGPAMALGPSATPVLAPDASALFVHAHSAGRGGLWALPLDGSGAGLTAPTVPLDTYHDPVQLAVSPDGREVAFTCDSAPGSGETDRRLCVWLPGQLEQPFWTYVTPSDDAHERVVGFVPW